MQRHRSIGGVPSEQQLLTILLQAKTHHEPPCFAFLLLSLLLLVRGHDYKKSLCVRLDAAVNRIVILAVFLSPFRHVFGQCRLVARFDSISHMKEEPGNKVFPRIGRRCLRNQCADWSWKKEGFFFRWLFLFYIDVILKIFMSVHITTTAPPLVCSGKLSVVEPSQQYGW